MCDFEKAGGMRADFWGGFRVLWRMKREGGGETRYGWGVLSTIFSYEGFSLQLSGNRDT